MVENILNMLNVKEPMRSAVKKVLDTGDLSILQDQERMSKLLEDMPMDEDGSVLSRHLDGQGDDIKNEVKKNLEEIKENSDNNSSYSNDSFIKKEKKVENVKNNALTNT
jgi:hypothetical protein